MTAAPKRNHNTHGDLPGSHPRVSICALQPQVLHTRVRYSSLSLDRTLLPGDSDRALPRARPIRRSTAGLGELSMPRLPGRDRCIVRSDNGMGIIASWTDILCEAHR